MHVQLCSLRWLLMVRLGFAGGVVVMQLKSRAAGSSFFSLFGVGSQLENGCCVYPVHAADIDLLPHVVGYMH